MSMADRIKEKRLQKGLTQEELAEKLGLQKSAVAKYENGRVENIKRSTIAKMSEILECSPTYLMGLEEKPSLLTADDARLIKKYHRLSEKKQQAVSDLIDSLLAEDD